MTCSFIIFFLWKLEWLRLELEDANLINGETKSHIGFRRGVANLTRVIMRDCMRYSMEGNVHGDINVV